MYHYTESGLKNQYLLNGYRRVKTPYGEAVVIDHVEELHKGIAWLLVDGKPSLSGPEFRFIRKTLGLTQAQVAEITGYDEQTARRWETLGRVPKWADHLIRFIYREYEDGAQPIRSAINRLRELDQQQYEVSRLKWELRKGPKRAPAQWKPVAKKTSKTAKTA